MCVAGGQSPRSVPCRLVVQKIAERDRRVGESPRVDPAAVLDQVLERMAFIPDVGVEGGENSSFEEPESRESPGALESPDDYLIPGGGVTAVLHAQVVLL